MPRIIDSSPVYDAGNSGTAITVNWANGVAQKIKLTGAALISFSNAVAGQEYTLTVTQDAWREFPVFFTDALEWPESVPVKQVITRRKNRTFKFLYGPGIVPADTSSSTLGTYGVAVGRAAASSQASVSSTTGMPMAMHPSGRALAVGLAASPYIAVYELINGNVGRRLAVPTLGSTARAVAFSPDGAFLAVGNATSPYIHVYNFDTDYGIGDATAALFYPPAGQVLALAFHPTSPRLAVGTDTSPYLHVYYLDQLHTYAGVLPQSPQAAQKMDASPIPGGAVQEITWHPEGNFFLAVTATDGARIWPFDVTSGSYGAFGAPLTVGAIYTGGTFSPDGRYVGLVASGAGVDVYSFNASSGATALVAGASTVSATYHHVLWSPNNDYIHVQGALGGNARAATWNPATNTLGSLIAGGVGGGSAVYTVADPQGRFGYAANATATPFVYGGRYLERSAKDYIVVEISP